MMLYVSTALFGQFWIKHFHQPIDCIILSTSMIIFSYRYHYRWALNDFGRYSSVTAMLQQLSWPSLNSRRQIFRLQTLFKIIHHDYSLLIPSCYLPMVRSTRQYHPRRFILPNSNIVLYQQSFYSRTIHDWNNLPNSLIDCDNIDHFMINYNRLFILCS